MAAQVHYFNLTRTCVVHIIQQHIAMRENLKNHRTTVVAVVDTLVIMLLISGRECKERYVLICTGPGDWYQVRVPQVRVPQRSFHVCPEW